MTKATRGLDRLQLARRLGVSARLVDRLVAAGLTQVGMRAGRKLYSVEAGQALLAKRRASDPATEQTRAADYVSHSEDLDDRRQSLTAAWIPRDVWQRLWLHCLAFLEAFTASWPAAIAARVAATSREELPRLLMADGPRVLPVARYDEWPVGDALVRELLAEESAWPRPEADVLALASARGSSAWYVTREAVRRGVAVHEGLWHRPPPDGRPWLEAETIAAVHELDRAEAEARALPALMRPLLESLGAAVAADPAHRALLAALAEPPAPPAPCAVTSSPAALARWRAARAAYRAARVAVRHDHDRRETVLSAILVALEKSKLTWWRWPGFMLDAVGNLELARQAAERLRDEALAPLQKLLDGAAPALRQARRPK